MLSCKRTDCPLPASRHLSYYTVRRLSSMLHAALGLLMPCSYCQAHLMASVFLVAICYSRAGYSQLDVNS